MNTNAACRPKRRRVTRLPVCVLLAAFLSGCAATPREVFRGYPGAELPSTSLATIELGDASWVTINDQPDELLRKLTHTLTRLTAGTDEADEKHHAAAEQAPLDVDGTEYSAVTLLPGTYRIAYGVSLLIDAPENRTEGIPGTMYSRPQESSMTWTSRTARATVSLEGGRTYRLRGAAAHRATAFYFWIEDSQGHVITGTKKP